MKKKYRFFFVIAITFLLVFNRFGSGSIGISNTAHQEAAPLDGLGNQNRTALQKAAKNPDAGILVMDDHGQILFARNHDKYMVPASIIKILTGLAALEHLGRNYRFVTRAACDSVSHTLYVRGTGDPLFVSEAIQHFCRQVMTQAQIKQIDKIVLDLSYFSENIRIPGTSRSLNPYDATTGALCANFNTIYFKQGPVTGTWVSAEPQTPLLDIFIPDIQKTGLTQGRILVSEQWRPLYSGLLMAHFFKEMGIAVSGKVETGIYAGRETDMIQVLSPLALDEVIKKLLTYSNNFVANQIMLALGAHVHGPPATLEKGISVLTKFAREQLKWNDVQIAEGSGLSRNTRVTPAQMGTLLMAFMPHHALMTRTDTQYYKTGTLTGIRTRAGYFIGTDQRLYPFVIMK